NQDGGTMNLGTLMIGPGGRYNLSAGNMTLSSFAAIEGNVLQTGGSLSTGIVKVDTTTGSGAMYDFRLGTLTATSTVIGEGGAGTFKQSGGTLTTNLTIADSPNSAGTYTLTAGSLITGDDMIGNSG